MSNAAAHDPATDSTLPPPPSAHLPSALDLIVRHWVDGDLRTQNAEWLYRDTLAALKERDAQVADLTHDLAKAHIELRHLRKLVQDFGASWNGGDK